MERLLLKDEKEIVESLQKGDFEAFEMIYNFYFDVLFLFSRKYLRSETEAEEMVQSVFLKIWDKRKMINPDLSFKAYIFKIILNDIYNHIRKKRCEKLAYDIYLESSSILCDSTQELIFCGDLKEKLDRLIGNLPPKRREIFILSRKRGLSNSEISDELNLSVRTVENQLHRALEYLKEKLKEDND